MERTFTKFLALDKCLPKRKFLQILDIAPSRKGSEQVPFTDHIQYDKAWLGVLRGMWAIEKDLHLGSTVPMPSREVADKAVLDGYSWICKALSDDDLRPHQFVRTAPPYPGIHRERLGSPQTDAIINRLGIKDRFRTIPYRPKDSANEQGDNSEVNGPNCTVKATNEIEDENEIDIDL